MIDEKRLQYWLDQLGPEPQGECTEQSVMTPIETSELIRLARLGLWAEKQGIPALRESVDLILLEYCSHHPEVHGSDKCYAKQQVLALAAIPIDATANTLS